LRTFQTTPLAEDDDLTEAGMPGWMVDQMPIYVTRDEEGRPIVLMPRSFDPISDAFIFFNQTGEMIDRVAFGGTPRTQEKLREDMRGESLDSFFDAVFSNFHVPWRIAYELIRGHDAFTGRSIRGEDSERMPSFLGIRMPAEMRLVLEKVPILGRLNTSNPWEMFGRAPQYDINGNVVDVGRLSIFGAERTERDRRLHDSVNQNGVLRLLRGIGINIQVIDYTEANRRTLSDITRTINHLEREINRTNEDLMLRDIRDIAEDPQERVRRFRELLHLTEMWGQLVVDKERVRAWMRERGVLSSDALRELDRLEIRVRDLPLPNQQKLDEIVERYAEKLLELRQTGEHMGLPQEVVEQILNE
jgi:hypothetical protein